MTIYMLKFSKPLGNERHQASYYLGFCDDGRLAERLAEHRAGQGARITAAAVQRGSALELVATWPGDRREERRLKRRKSHARLLARHGAGIALALLAASLLTFGGPAPASAAVDAPGRATRRCRGWLVALDPPAYRFECRRVAR